MSFFKKIDQVLARFGNMRAMQRTHVDTYTEGRIENVVGEKYGEARDVDLWIAYQELAGYYFINTSVIGPMNLKTNKGATLEFEDKNGKGFVVESDDYMVESDFSNVSNRYLTKINYCLEKDQIDAVINKKFTKIIFNIKKGGIIFDVIQ